MTRSSQSIIALLVLYSHLIVCITFPLLFASVNTSSENMDSKALSTAVAKFSAKFCNELDKDKSVVSSPLSAEFVLALLTLGSKDDVHTELLAALGVPDDDSIRSSFSDVSSKIKSIKGVTLNVANKVYIMDGDYEINANLKEDAVKVFDAEFEKLNFANGQAAANTINQWVENKTNDRIKDLLSGDSLDASTRLVLVNALYFKGTWTKQFESHMTHPRPFYVSEGKTINVPMMNKEDRFRYGESGELKAQFLQMEYVGGEASMVIVLPEDINGLDEVMQKLATGFDLMSELDKLYSTKVNVSIPKFKIETEIDLAVVLPKLGISSIFDQNNTGLRDLLDKPEPLFVSKAVQKAFIEVNEEGAEAAAATALVFRYCSAIIDLDPVQQFVANRPFLATIVSDGVPYFFTSYRAMVATFCSAIIDLDPVQQFVADRPFLATIVSDGVPYFFTSYRGDE